MAKITYWKTKGAKGQREKYSEEQHFFVKTIENLGKIR